MRLELGLVDLLDLDQPRMMRQTIPPGARALVLALELLGTLCVSGPVSADASAPTLELLQRSPELLQLGRGVGPLPLGLAERLLPPDQGARGLLPILDDSLGTQPVAFTLATSEDRGQRPQALLDAPELLPDPRHPFAIRAEPALDLGLPRRGRSDGGDEAGALVRQEPHELESQEGQRLSLGAELLLLFLEAPADVRMIRLVRGHLHEPSGRARRAQLAIDRVPGVLRRLEPRARLGDLELPRAPLEAARPAARVRLVVVGLLRRLGELTGVRSPARARRRELARRPAERSEEAGHLARDASDGLLPLAQEPRLLSQRGQVGQHRREELVLEQQRRALPQLGPPLGEVRCHLRRELGVEGDLYEEANEVRAAREPERLVGRPLAHVHRDLVAEQLRIQPDRLQVVEPAAVVVLDPRHPQLRATLRQPVQPVAELLEGGDGGPQAHHRQLLEPELFVGPGREEQMPQPRGVLARLLALPADHLPDHERRPVGVEQSRLARRDAPLRQDDRQVARLDVLLELAGLAVGLAPQELPSGGLKRGEEQVQDRRLAAAVAKPDDRVGRGAVRSQVDRQRRQARVGVAHGREVDPEELRHAYAVRRRVASCTSAKARNAPSSRT